MARELLEHHTISGAFSDEAVAYSDCESVRPLCSQLPGALYPRMRARAERSHVERSHVELSRVERSPAGLPRAGPPMAGLPGRGWEMPCWLAADSRSEVLRREWTEAPAPALSKHVTGLLLQGGIGLLQTSVRSVWWCSWVHG